MDHLALLEAAKAVLQKNRRGGFTVPRDKLYPFQWNWDSGFVALGLANYDVRAAMEEIESLLSGQWANGMIPHIIFHSENESTYFPNWDFWQAEVNSGSPKTPKTSGISQPPVLGFVLEAILEKHPDNQEVLDFAKKVFPKIVHYHRFWYSSRDPHREGLAYIYHPWESGRDNSPIWDDALDQIDLENAHLPSYQRRDTSIADASERPTSAQYDQYVYLLELGKKHRYDDDAIAHESEFVIQDSLINALLIRSNEGLIRVGEQLGLDTGELKQWQNKSKARFNEKLWNEELGTYTGYDLQQAKAFPYWEIGGLTALYANIPDKVQAAKMVSYLEKLVTDGFFLVPSFDVHHPLFDSKRYWRGPVWPQMNWLVYKGLHNYGYHDLANTVKENLLHLVDKFGFHEYFEAQLHLTQQQHGGYGGDTFSWTASTIIDFLSESNT